MRGTLNIIRITDREYIMVSSNTEKQMILITSFIDSKPVSNIILGTGNAHSLLSYLKYALEEDNRKEHLQ